MQVFQYSKSYQCAFGGVGGSHHAPICLKLQESESKVKHSAGDLATVFSMTFLFSSNSSFLNGQNTPWPKQRVSAHYC